MSVKRERKVNCSSTFKPVICASHQEIFVDEERLDCFVECVYEHYSASGPDLHVISSFYERHLLSAGKEDNKCIPKVTAEEVDWDLAGSLTIKKKPRQPRYREGYI